MSNKNTTHVENISDQYQTMDRTYVEETRIKTNVEQHVETDISNKKAGGNDMSENVNIHIKANCDFYRTHPREQC